jgi:hypothetical protein
VYPFYDRTYYNRFKSTSGAFYPSLDAAEYFYYNAHRVTSSCDALPSSITSWPPAAVLAKLSNEEYLQRFPLPDKLPYVRQWQPTASTLAVDIGYTDQSGAVLPTAAPTLGATSAATVVDEKKRALQPNGSIQLTDQDTRTNWNRLADQWSAGYDDDGDSNRRYQSDEPMLAMIGDVKGRRILDVGSGNGYLSRKLSKAGGILIGVENSDNFYKIAVAAEAKEPLGIQYHRASACDMHFIPDRSIDIAVANYVLMVPHFLFLLVISSQC